MNFDFLNNLPRMGFLSIVSFRRSPNPIATITETPKQQFFFDIKLWGCSLLPFVPWVLNAREKFRIPATMNRRLQQQHKGSHGALDIGGGCSVPLFRPYVAKVPWHDGPRGFLSQLFPRYGHYCGPNWSSGKDNGSLLWDKRPIDWLDFCCYCHDIGYDSHDQAKLLKADLAFLECLERPRMSTKGDAGIANLYRKMCITGLRIFLIPYRRHLVRLQEGQSLIEWSLNRKK